MSENGVFQILIVCITKRYSIVYMRAHDHEVPYGWISDCLFRRVHGHPRQAGKNENKQETCQCHLTHLHFVDAGKTLEIQQYYLPRYSKLKGIHLPTNFL